ncbi:dephospho-CoA kinase [Rickettsiella endosymbiont of Dermanyssus gallinae]|uniref:dephospho-CoA kinase n=1 Tax=Rickettsiella endosymbiont of Dermanyssus gallinae TaxID=2856608 RepID=UPI001C52E77A|nr:dephospho-CoA kinase [Rickettsiella endosymbiont of Dermanyssus gallinae]
MFTVALTGGIASGKSTLARCFSDLGVTVIDADQIAHKIMCDLEVLQQVVAYFGPSILTADKQLHRPSLREIIFSDSTARNFLEQLLHPLIYKQIHESIQLVKSIYCLVVIPLLFEERTASLLKEKPASGIAIELNRVMLVTAPNALQIQRAQERDQAKKEQIDAILSAQISVSEGLNKADDIIYNKTTLSDLRHSAARFHRMYLAFAHAKNITLEQSAFLRYYLAIK